MSVHLLTSDSYSSFASDRSYNILKLFFRFKIHIVLKKPSVNFLFKKILVKLSVQLLSVFM